jgi:alpha-tubulin suppressor-like RCC1 family protein
LGNGTADTNAHPLASKILVDNVGAGFSNIVMLSARDYHNIAVKADGSVWMWGANDQGQCGDNTTIDRWRPVQVTGLGPRVGLPLKIQPSTQSGYIDLAWSSATGEYFSVECSTNLATGFTATLQSNIPATPPLNTIPVPLTNGTSFYRLKF